MTQSPFELGMQGVAEQLLAALRKTEGFEHRLTKGEARERELGDALRPYLPARYTFGSGEVVNAAGERSDQQDLLILDTQHVPPFLLTGAGGIYPIEAVVAAIQVKTELGSLEEILGAIANLKSLVRLIPDGKRRAAWIADGDLHWGDTPNRPITAVMAYRLGARRETVCKRWHAANEIQEVSDRAGILFVLGEFVQQWFDPAAYKRHIWPDARATHTQASFGTTMSMARFYGMLMIALSEYTPPDINWRRYLPIENPFEMMTIGHTNGPKNGPTPG